MGVSYIDHKGKRILYVDFRGLKSKEMMEVIEDLGVFLKVSEPTIQTLYDCRYCAPDIEFMAEAKRMGKEFIDKKNGKAAILGINGIKSLLFQAYIAFTGDNIKIFESEEEAKDYLVT